MSGFEVVAIGASLGGVDALRTLLSALPREFPAAVVVVQHRGADGDEALANVLARSSALPVREAGDGDALEPGVVFVAPAGYHLLVDRGALRLSVDGPVSWARPSIDVLFESAAESYGRRAVAVLLTCSSEDGADGIAAVAERGGMTIVEDPASATSPVAGELALAKTQVRHVLPLEKIAAVLDCVTATGER